MKRQTLLPLILCALVSHATIGNADLIVEIGGAQANLAPGFGTTTALFDVDIRNSMASAIDLDGYTLLLDIAPISNDAPGLPAGVSFGSPEATYHLPAGLNNTATNPAAGDLGVNQLFVLGTTLDAGASVTALTINLEIDRATAIAGDYGVSLNLTGENAINFSIGGGSTMNVAPTFTPGTLVLTAVPEPSAFLFLALVGSASSVCVCVRRRFRWRSEARRED